MPGRLTQRDHYTLWFLVDELLKAGSWQEDGDEEELARMTAIRDKLAARARVIDSGRAALAATEET